MVRKDHELLCQWYEKDPILRRNCLDAVALVCHPDPVWWRTTSHVLEPGFAGSICFNTSEYTMYHVNQVLFYVRNAISYHDDNRTATVVRWLQSAFDQRAVFLCSSFDLRFQPQRY